MTGTGPLFPSHGNKGSRNIAPSGNPAPLHPTRGGAVLRQTFGVRVSWTYCWSIAGPAGHRAECTAPRFPPKALGVVHLLSISARVIRPLNARLKR